MKKIVKILVVYDQVVWSKDKTLMHTMVNKYIRYIPFLFIYVMLLSVKTQIILTFWFILAQEKCQKALGIT